MPRQIAIPKVPNEFFKFKRLILVLNKNANSIENRNPEKHHKTKDSFGEDIKIIFFKTAASHPVKNNAQNLKIMSFLNNSLKLTPSFTVSKINQLPIIINRVPKSPFSEGISPSKIYPKIKPTMHL